MPILLKSAKRERKNLSLKPMPTRPANLSLLLHISPQAARRNISGRLRVQCTRLFRTPAPKCSLILIHAPERLPTSLRQNQHNGLRVAGEYSLWDLSCVDEGNSHINFG